MELLTFNLFFNFLTYKSEFISGIANTIFKGVLGTLNQKAK